MQPTSLVLTFSSALDPTPAQNVNNYQILTSQGVAIPVSSAVYDASALTVTLSPSQLLSLHQSYQLTVIGMPPSGLTSATGVPIDGAGNGTSGTNYVETFSGDILAGPSPELLRTNPRRFAAEKRELAAVERSLRASDARLAATHKRQATAGNQSAAEHNKLAAQAKGLAASAVDQLLGSGAMKVKRILARRHR